MTSLLLRWSFLVLSLLEPKSSADDETVVVTSSGPIRGKHLPAGSRTVTAYLGIPYAEPPVGKLRFQKPVSHQPWSHILEATNFGNSCPQIFLSGMPEAETFNANTPLSEDCLFLNVWVPHPRPSTPAAVLVWIHGGGFYQGTASLAIYDGAFLAATQNVLVVSMNYRLGVLGFLSLPPACPGNMGLWDQQLALRWVRENAAAFGGDPTRITIFGESAGGASVSYHLLSPGSQPLFARAVLQSGTATAPWAWLSPEEAKRRTLSLAGMMGCTEGDNTAIVSCLQEKKMEDFQTYMFLVVNHKTVLNLPFVPTTDGDFLPDDPQKLVESRRFQSKPIMVGTTSDEGSFFVYLTAPSSHKFNESLLTWEELLMQLNTTIPNATEDVIQSIALTYSKAEPEGPAQNRSALTQAWGDYFFVCPSNRIATETAKNGIPVYAYTFTHRTNESSFPEWMGATHGSEVLYLFGTQTVLPGTNVTHTKAELELITQVMQYWADFARSGNPTPSDVGEKTWPLYDPEEQNFFRISTEPPQVMTPSPARHCGLWSAHLSEASRPNATVVVTSSGRIRGKHLPAGSGTVTAYLGIPYAEPPVGKLRLQKPVPHQPWSHILEATNFGNSCPQIILSGMPGAEAFNPNTPLSEDCLFLNVWVPHPRPSIPAAVLVWIHGGGFYLGTASLAIYDGAFLASTQNVLVVSMNYRLGALGFLSLPPACPGNMGLWDQQLALRWVRENAAAFGGDPTRITIFGESAGGASVSYHLLSPGSQPLFARAVLQSGTATAPWAWVSPEEAKRRALSLAGMMGCTEGDNTAIVSCLQEKKMEDFQTYMFLVVNPKTVLNLPFVPTTDGDFLPDDPQKLVESRDFQSKPIMIGTTSDEGSIFVYLAVSSSHTFSESLLTWEELLMHLNATIPNATEDVIQSIALTYSKAEPEGPAQNRSALSQAWGDYYIVCPSNRIATETAKNGIPVYAYTFTHHTKGSIFPEWMGSAHGSEVPYLFGTLTALLGTNRTCTEAELELISQMMQYWADFARSGNPTPSDVGEKTWPLYDPEEENFFRISTEPPQVMTPSPARHCGLWSAHLSEASRPKHPSDYCVPTSPEGDEKPGICNQEDTHGWRKGTV
ncbi:uncharacterized protein LOC143831559 isoform X2 [Paroedura picta]|uniref:uncharacterized protein LOC143831559 isoform X2 n=1 Tax=Paroedura picta TaxID=143630 RepID=UPI00405716C5